MKYFNKSKNSTLVTIDENGLLESPIGVAVVPVSVPLTPIDSILEPDRYSSSSLFSIIEIRDSVIVNAPVEEQQAYKDKWWFPYYGMIMLFLLAGTVTIVIANAVYKNHI